MVRGTRRQVMTPGTNRRRAPQTMPEEPPAGFSERAAASVDGPAPG